MKKVISVILAASFGILATLNSIPLDYRYAEHSFTIRLSDRWEPIPIEFLEEYSRSMSADLPKGVACQYGFQLADSEMWFELPFILIMINEKGKYPIDYLRNSQTMEEIRENFYAKIDENREVSETILEQPVFDEANNVVWMIMKSDIQDVGTVWAMSAAVLTELGSIGPTLYVNNEQKDIYISEFQEIVRTLEVDDEIRYIAEKPEATAGEILPDFNARVSQGLKYLILFAVIGAIVGIARIAQRKIKQMKSAKQRDWMKRRQEVWKMNDIQKLQEIAKNDPDEDVRSAAIERLDELS